MELLQVIDKAQSKVDFDSNRLKAVLEINDLGFQKGVKKELLELTQQQKLSKIFEFGYKTITNEKIMKFLNRKADIYNKKRGNSDKTDQDVGYLISCWKAGFWPTDLFAERYDPRLLARTCDYMSDKGIGQFVWDEIDIEDYKGLPPKSVLITLKKHKKREIFDYFTVGTVKNIPDPLLMGRVNNINNTRWFIDNWGTDVCLDDVI